MTSSGYKSPLFLLVFFNTIYQLEGGCLDYFKLENMTNYLSENIAIINAKKSEDIMTCSLLNILGSTADKIDSLGDKFILDDCCGLKENETNLNIWKERHCTNESLGNVTLYNFRCFIAKQMEKKTDKRNVFQVSQCGDYEQVIKLYSQIFLNSNSPQTSAPSLIPASTAASTTASTAASVTVTDPSTTLESTTTLQSEVHPHNAPIHQSSSVEEGGGHIFDNTTSTTTTQSTTTEVTSRTITQANATSNQTTSNSGGADEPTIDKQIDKETENKTLMALLIMSLCLNVFLLIYVCLYNQREPCWHLQRKRIDENSLTVNLRPSEATSLNPNGSEALQNLSSNGDVQQRSTRRANNFQFTHHTI